MSSCAYQQSVVSHLLARSVGLICLLAGVSKLIDPYVYLATLDAYGVFSASAAVIIAAFVPRLEVILGVSLAADISRLTCSRSVVVVSVSSLSLQISAIMRGLELSPASLPLLGGDGSTASLVSAVIVGAGAAIVSALHRREGSVQFLNRATCIGPGVSPNENPT